MRGLKIVTVGALISALCATAALARPGVATGNVNLRTEPNARAYRLTTIPVGAPVEIHGCPSWCNVTFDGVTGWASSLYIAEGGYYAPAPPVVVYERPRRYYGDPFPWYGRPYHRHRRHHRRDGYFSFGAPGFGVYFGF